ncbi:hypothetical protein EZS27_010106 [termite gut metagenome]|uniref:Uncharacterized protein n=1 Tax=termite gut metagenome TaxID=433724 RepID=A0A5J4SA17_9ZZZZ
MKKISLFLLFFIIALNLFQHNILHYEKDFIDIKFYIHNFK